MNSESVFGFENSIDIECRMNVFEEQIKFLTHNVKKLEKEVKEHKNESIKLKCVIKDYKGKINGLEGEVKELNNQIKIFKEDDTKNANKENDKERGSYSYVSSNETSLEQEPSSSNSKSPSATDKDVEKKDSPKLEGCRKLNNTFLFVGNRKFNCELCLPSIIEDDTRIKKYCFVKCHFTYKSIGLVLEVRNEKKSDPYINMMIKCGLPSNEDIYNTTRNSKFIYIKVNHTALVNFKVQESDIYLKFGKRPIVNKIYQLLTDV